MTLKRAKVQALAGALAPESGADVEDSSNKLTTVYGQLLNAPMSGATSATCEAAFNGMQQRRQQQQLHPLAATRRGHLVQSRKEALSRSRLDEWQSQEAQRKQDYATAAEQHAAQKARLLAAAAEKRAEVQRLEADAEARSQQQAELRAQQKQLFAFKQALVEQMQQTQINRGGTQPLRSATNSETSTAFAAAKADGRLLMRS